MKLHTLLLSVALASAAAVGCKGSAEPTVPTVPAEPITEASLATAMTARFQPLITEGILDADFGSAGVGQEIVTELGQVGITDTAQLAAMIPADFDTKGYPVMRAQGSATFAGLARDLMIIHNADAYVTKAFHGQYSSGPGDYPLPNAYGITDEKLAQLGLFGGDGGEFGGGGYGLTGGGYGGLGYAGAIGQ